MSDVRDNEDEPIAGGQGGITGGESGLTDDEADDTGPTDDEADEAREDTGPPASPEARL